MLKFCILLFLLTKDTLCDDVFYNINSNNVLHKVSEKFLSISIDPAVLLAGANLSEASLLLARHLSPAYIRLAGPSTPFVKYIDNEDDLISRKSAEGTNVVITPSMWFGINEWLNLANLTPVFGINDNETDKGVWDPKSTLPLLEMSDKFGVTCYWQLGYDCSNKSTIQYVEDLNILRQILNGFPGHNSTWKIVGSDLSKCILDELDNHNFENYVSDLDENIDAVLWESAFLSKMELGFTKSALWTSVPKDSKPVTFSSAMEWAKKIGRAATMEYDVIFRHPRLLEMTHDTPVYWFSFLHKKLMGINVLDVRPTNPNPDLYTFAHCTKKQNNFVRTGAVTIMMINNGSETNTANIRLGNIMLDKSMEVQSYVLTVSDESTTEVYLNNQKLTMNMLKRADDILKPKLRRAKIRGYVSLEIPSQSIGFFILTGAKNTLCSNNEEDISSILAEINKDQDLSVSEEVQFEIEGRWKNAKEGDKSNTAAEKITLETIKKNILKEMELDKSYYNKMLNKQKSNGANSVQDNFRDIADMNQKKETIHKHLRAFIDKAKKSDLSKDSEVERQKEKHMLPSSNFHFTIKEVEDILKNRARAKAAAKNIKLTSSELDMLVDKATIRLPKHFLSKRDINALLLEEKANFHKNNMFSQETYEQYARQHKLFPKLKFRRSDPGYNRIRRNINEKLLNMKAKLEEHKKYMLERNSNLRNSHSHKHHGISRVKRDINLDLLKKHTGPNFSHGKHIAVQPNLNSYKKYFHDDIDGKYVNRMTDEISDELFPDFLESGEDTKKSSKLFAETADLDLSDLEGLFKEPKSKHKLNFYSLSSKPKWDFSLTRKTTPKKKNKSKFYSNEYSPTLRSSDELENFEDDFLPCNNDWGFSDESPKVKSSRFTDLWQLRSPKIERNKKEKSSVTDLDDLLFPHDFGRYLENEYLRRKRDSNSIAKEKHKYLTDDIKNKVKELRNQMIEAKVRYVREKIENKMELTRQKQIKKLQEKASAGTIKNIQIVPKSKEKNENYNYNNKNSKENILNANMSENLISTSIGNKIKRSLMSNNLNSLFGQYQPLTTGLKPWRPIDILGLQNSYLNTLPLYTWMQNQNLRNMLLQNGYYGLRKRRYIEDGSGINSIENEILSNEEQKKENEEIDKTEFVKYPKKNIVKENMLENNRNINIETTIKLETYNTTPVAIKKETTRESFYPVVDKMVSGKKMSYLERVLGKNKVKPLEDFYENVKMHFNKMNKNIKDFFSKIF